MSQKIIKLTESQLRDIVYKVISEQTINEDTTTGFGYGDALVKPSVDPKTQERINNIAKNLIANKGTLPIDYVTKYQIKPEEQTAAQNLIKQQQATQNTQNQRYVNIANTMGQVGNDLKIKSTNPKLNGMSWADYMDKFKVTQDDVTKAQAYVATLGKTDPNAAKKLALGLANASKASKPDQKVMELQKQLKAAGYDLGKTGPNKDGIDGIMGSRTKAAQQLMAQKGQQGVQDMAKQGQQFMNKLNSYGKTASQLTPQQQAVADALKNGQPLPGSSPTTQTATPPPVDTTPPKEFDIKTNPELLNYQGYVQK